MLYQRNKMLEEASSGRFIIETHPAGAIMGATEAFDATNDGTIDLFNGTLHTWIGKLPASPLFSARPLGFTAPQFAAWFEDYGGLEFEKEMLQDFNFGYAGYMFISTPEDFCWSNVKMDTLEAWKGVKFRTKGLWANILQDPRVGASVVTIAGGELYSALERGILDATEYSIPATDKALGFYEICKYLMVPGIHQPSTVYSEVVNADSWAALPDDLKLLYDYVNKYTNQIGYGEAVLKDAEALKFFEELPKLEIVVIPDKLQQQFFEIANDTYKQESDKDPFFAKVYQNQLDFLKEWRRWANYQTPKF